MRYCTNRFDFWYGYLSTGAGSEDAAAGAAVDATTVGVDAGSESEKLTCRWFRSERKHAGGRGCVRLRFGAE